MDIMLNRIIDLIGSERGARKKLALHLGFANANIITDWESKRVKSYPKYAAEIADYFNVSLDYLSGKTDEKKPVINNDELNEKKKLWINLYEQIPENRRDEYFAMLEAALKAQGLWK
jgi:transcriptional regulator with XRE-family HTH domain